MRNALILLFLSNVFLLPAFSFSTAISCASVRNRFFGTSKGFPEIPTTDFVTAGAGFATAVATAVHMLGTLALLEFKWLVMSFFIHPLRFISSSFPIKDIQSEISPGFFFLISHSIKNNGYVFAVILYGKRFFATVIKKANPLRAVSISLILRHWFP